uniref:Uncharacterized protein n=1 Tax=Oryza nivara TaxID=4536 RepID=A0A0E0I9C5_ORYNI
MKYSYKSRILVHNLFPYCRSAWVSHASTTVGFSRNSPKAKPLITSAWEKVTRQNVTA